MRRSLSLFIVCALLMAGTAAGQTMGAEDSIRTLNRKLEQALHQVDSLKHRVDSIRHIAIDQDNKVEDLKSKLPPRAQPASPEKMALLRKKLRIGLKRFDSILVQLDTCTGALNEANSRLEELIPPRQ
jgi:hypothetical protein